MMKCFQICKDGSKSKSKSGATAGGRSTTNRVVKVTGSRSSIAEMYKEKKPTLRVFSLSELLEAANNFNRLLRVGEGGFGSVYKGSIRLADGQDEPTIVAIKKLNTQGCSYAETNFSAINFPSEPMQFRF